MRATFHLNTELLQHHVDNHKGLTARCRNLKPRERDSIQHSAELKEFLPRAINFLQANSSRHPAYSEQVAHYLMGKVSYLPEGLAAPLHEIPKPIRTLLHDLLRVHRHDFMGKREAPEKTINKLQFLNNQLFDYNERLAAWKDSAPSGEQEARKIAVHEIYSAMYRGIDYLDLSGLDLTSLPPLPQDLINNLKSLDLYGNKLTSLVGLPEHLPKLESLSLRDNQLASLAGMPSHLDSLLNLWLNKNELTSLVGLPEHLPKLERLTIEENRLSSLAGMPACLDRLEDLSLNKNELTSLVGLPEHLPQLERLDLQDNQLASLAGMPSHLNNLRLLSLDNNNLTSLASMPLEMNRLNGLDLRHNRLTSLEGAPESILQSPARIRVQSNPLSQESIQAINNLENGAIIQFDMRAHEIRPRLAEPLQSLEDQLKRWFPDMDTDPWTHHDETDKASLATLLERLHRSAAFQGEERADSMAELKDILDGMREDPVFRAYGFTLAHGASADCSDNVQAIFDEMRMQLANPVTRKDGTLDTVMQFYVGREKAALISEYVGTLRGGDPLESVMLLQHELSADLALPIRFKSIQYARTASVSNDLAGHKARALRFVNDRINPERVIGKMLEEAPAVDFLKRTYARTFTAHQLLWTDALDPTDKRVVPAHHPLLHAARRSPLGDGRQLLALQQKAELALLKAVATHAMENSGMSELDRTRFEIGRLTADPDWCEYIARSDVQADVINKFNLGDSTRPRSVEAWTLDVLASAMGTH